MRAYILYSFHSLIPFTSLLFLIFISLTEEKNSYWPFADEYDKLSYSNEKTGFQWFWTLDGPSYADEGSDLSIDDQGNVFLTGHHGGLDLDRDGNLDLEADVIDPLIMKLSWKDKDQRVRMEWIYSAKTPGWNKGQRVAADYQGGAYLMGRFREKVDFNKSISIKGGGGNDAYITRIGSDGSALWAIPFGGPGPDVLWDLTSDKKGNVYLLGWSEGDFLLDNNGFQLPKYDQAVSIIYSLDPNGKLRWHHVIPGSVGLRFIDISPNGKLCITGEFGEAVDFNGDHVKDLTDPGELKGFAYIIDTQGQFINSWMIAGGPAKPTFDPNDELFLMGAFGQPIQERYGHPDFDKDGYPDISVKNRGDINTWIGSFDLEGKLNWLSTYEIDRAADLVCDGNRLVMCGSYLGIHDLDGDGIMEESDKTVDPIKELELAVLVMDPKSGSPLEVFIAPGPGNDHASSVVILRDTNIINVTGFIQLTADFSRDGIANEGRAKCEALGDIFYAEYKYK